MAPLQTMNTYLANFILGSDCSQLDVPTTLQRGPMVQEVYKGWSRIVEFTRRHDLKEEVQVVSITTNVLLTILWMKANEK